MFLEFLVSLVLAGVALFLIGYLCKVAFTPLLALAKTSSNKAQGKRFDTSLQKIDKAISEKRYDQALALLEKGIRYEKPNNLQTIVNLREYHQNVLSRCLIVAEELGTKITNIAELEKTLIQRFELQELFIQAQDSMHRFKQRRLEKGKSAPDWSVGDYKSKIEKISKEIKENDKQFKNEFRVLFRSLNEQKKASQQPMYH